MLVTEHACNMVCVHMHTAKEEHNCHNQSRPNNARQKNQYNNQHNNTTTSHITKYIKNKYKL